MASLPQAEDTDWARIMERAWCRKYCNADQFIQVSERSLEGSSGTSKRRPPYILKTRSLASESYLDAMLYSLRTSERSLRQTQYGSTKDRVAVVQSPFATQLELRERVDARRHATSVAHEVESNRILTHAGKRWRALQGPYVRAFKNDARHGAFTTP